MKKLLISALAAVGIAAIALPAFAIEHEFGGYWRTRAYTQQDYGWGWNLTTSGAFNQGGQDLTQVDTRTRLYYTAKFSENFKFVNKFEFNTTWGDDRNGGNGEIGTDGKDDFRIKNSYVDLTFCDWNTKIGLQGATYARGFLFDDDFAGITLTYNGANFKVPMVWMKATEGGIGDDANDFDVDYLLLTPTFNVNENFAINPFFMYVRSDDLRRYNDRYYDYYGYNDQFVGGSGFPFPSDAEEANLFYIGLNADFNFDALSLWFTGIYSFGTVDKSTANGLYFDPTYVASGGSDYDVSAFLVAIGGEYDFGVWGIHGQAFYASGDDDDTDDDIDAFIAPMGQSYYWSEIMGFKTFDNQSSFNSPNERISNLWAVNLGATFKPTERWMLEADVWYAQRDENVWSYDPHKGVISAHELGTEIDLAATYKVFENMDLRFVGAYLFAGDATGDDDPWLLGTQLEFRF